MNDRETSATGPRSGRIGRPWAIAGLATLAFFATYGLTRVRMAGAKAGPPPRDGVDTAGRVRDGVG